ncbi:ABC transporter substrate-binding protein [Rhodopseudomonas pseudopalustris]|uniref:ABC transporter substrate-binding protein n=1 Tax=Rhodopseudomonas pseudopalustris TaxID=1513892 RepID=UPI000B85493F|nr:ABC transporter substrate-binding protein [Rhodopseudomonas pseudopalustris]
MRSTQLAGLLFTSALVAAPAAYADVKVGALYPFSGQLALLGQESARGLEIAVDEVNKKGGLKGEKIILERGDAVDNNQAVGEARRLISRERVKAIFGSYSSARSIAASQVAELSQIPYFELGAVADEVTTRKMNYLFRTNPTSEDMARLEVKIITEKIAPDLGRAPRDIKVAVIHEDGSYGSSVAAHQKRLVVGAGLNLVSVQSYSPATIDMSSIVLDLKQRGVDVVLQNSFQNDTTLFLQQAREAGFKPKAIIGAGGGYSMQPTLEAVGQATMEGVLVVDFPQFKMSMEGTPGLREFVAAYQAKYGTLPRSGHSLVNYFGAKAILESMSKLDDLNAKMVVSEIKKLDVPDGATAVGFGVKFDDENQNLRARMSGMQWQGGELVTVFPDTIAISPMKFAK